MICATMYCCKDDDSDCVLCSGGIEETVEHLFFTCPFSRRCWDVVGMEFAGPGNRLNLIHTAKRGWTRPMFMETLVTSAWSIWKERNGKIFRRIPPSVDSWNNRFREDFSLLAHRVKPSLAPFVESFSSSIV